MTDVFLSVGLEADLALIERELRFTNSTQIESGTAFGLTWAVSRVDDFALWGPGWDPSSQTRILIGGRIALEDSEWAAAERLPCQGGLAARHLLSLWLSRGAPGVSEYNGAALIVVIDERQREAHVWTDRMGFFPAFAAKKTGDIIASHPDVIARVCAAAGWPLEIDNVTIAEFLRTGTSTFPHTYWREVRHLDSGRRFHLAFHAGGEGLREREVYWKPAFLKGEPPLVREAFVESFAHAFRAAGRRRSSHRLGRTAVLLSAGADSRGILAAMSSPSEVDCYTYFDEPNEELRGARKIAALAGARHFPLQRARDYYVANAAETVRLSGGMWSMDSGHHAGFAKTLREARHGTLLTGDYCDFLFKGVGLNRKPLKFLGRNLPLYALSGYDPEYYYPHSPVASDWVGKVDDRLRERFPAPLRRDPDQRKVEFLRASPLSRDDVASAHLSLWRLAPFDFFVADKDILELYGRMSIGDKISGIAFGQAIARVTGPRIASVPNNNFGAPVGTTEAGRVAAFLWASARRKLLRRATHRVPNDPNSVATAGSWPDFARVALNSPIMRAWFDDLPKAHGETLLTYIHPSRRKWTFEEYATQDVFQLFRLITVDLWLRQTRDWQSLPPGASSKLVDSQTLDERRA